MARISGRSGTLIVCTDTPYERELLIEHVDAYAKQHGRVLLEFNHAQREIPAGAGTPPTCTACRRRLDKLTFWLGRRTVCDACASRTVP